MKSALALLLISTLSYASIEVDYANIYADFLIEKFDSELDSTLGPSALQGETYARILAAREMIEHHGHESITEYKSKSILTVQDVKIYAKVVNEINANAILIQNYQNKMLTNEQVIYPSSGRDGNLTGNTYPENAWSLTFDDGPHASRTFDVIENLENNNLRASFFVLMRQANKYPEAIDAVLKADMELALHSYNHLNLEKQDSETVEYEITESKRELEDTFKSEIKIFRLPYGAGMRNSMLRDVITKNNMVHIFWNVDTLDWKDKDPESIFNRTIKQMSQTPNRSGIILFHDVHPQTVIASEMVMEYLNRESKSVCTVGEMINYLNKLPQDCLQEN